MASILNSQTFIVIWIGFLLLMSCGIGLFFLWGIRNGQFQDQDRARYLPLQSGIPPATEERSSRQADDAEADTAEIRALDGGTSFPDATLPLPPSASRGRPEDSVAQQDAGGSP